MITQPAYPPAAQADPLAEATRAAASVRGPDGETLILRKVICTGGGGASSELPVVFQGRWKGDVDVAVKVLQVPCGESVRWEAVQQAGERAAQSWDQSLRAAYASSHENIVSLL